MATINLNNALKFLRERDEKTRAEAVRMSADPHIGTIPSRFIDPATGTARPGTVAPAPAGADPFVKTKHGFFARNYGPPAGTQGQGGVSMAAQYPRVARTAGTQGQGGVSMGADYPRRVGTQGRGGVSMDAAYPRTPGTQGRGGVSMQAPYRVPSPRPTFTPGDLSRWGGQKGQIENLVSPGMMYRDPTWAGIPRPRPISSPNRARTPLPPIKGFANRVGMGGFTGGASMYDMAKDPTWAGIPKAQVTVTQEEGKPTKKVTKYDVGQDDTLREADQGRASSEYQISGMLRRAMANQDKPPLPPQTKSIQPDIGLSGTTTPYPGSFETHPVNLQPWPVRKAYWGDDRDLQLMSLDQEEGLYRAPIRKSARERLNDLLRQIERSREGTTMAPFDLGQRFGWRNY
jgi:hypothetical protein